MYKKFIKLFIFSFLSLFVELLLIKWIPAQVRIVGYYTNFILISSFFGLGIGFILARSGKKTFKLFPLFLLALLAMLTLFKTFYIKPSGNEILFMEINYSAKTFNLIVFLISIFFLNGFIFLSLGTEIGRRFKTGNPAASYAANIAGSISGVLLMMVFSLLKINPLYQFIFVLLIVLLLMAEKKVVFPLQVLLCILAVFLVYENDRNSSWSLYHKIGITPLQYDEHNGRLHEKYQTAREENLVDLPEDIGFNISVNDDYFQKALDLSDEYAGRYDFLKVWRENYDLPFKLKKAGKVLIVGGGVGNDAAAALRNDVKIIDVVDIEGGIIDIGRKRHPESPYSDPRVNVIVDDARSFFSRTKNRYDLIIYSYVDSHRLFSHMSSVRLDSFLYTVESFKQAKDLLAEGGILFVNCSLSKTWVEHRIYKMLELVFDKKPLTVNGAISPAFINGNSEIANPEKTVLIAGYRVPSDTLAATDDWPYIYLKGKNIPFEYLMTIIVIISIASASVLTAFGKYRIGISKDTLFYFFAGFSFFLLETKNITDMAVLFGSTWMVNSIVILSVLISILSANIAVMKIRGINIRLIFIPLFLSLIILYFFPIYALVHLNLPIKLIFSVIMIGIPIFLGSVIFCHYFRDSRNPETDFGINMIGSIFGGFFEYVSLIAGFKFLLIAVLVLYMMMFLLKAAGKKG